MPGEYQLLAPHFHWGKNELEGSEHLVKGKAFPLEMHAVTFKKEYGNIQAALDSGKSDALAVLGVMFTLAEDAEGKEEYLLRPFERPPSIDANGSKETKYS